ncbi:MAG: hypothetical protein FJ121_01660 [Deltaproteobacteria bacterium]|nr:hypothetical protein [Deltaproteobacteria bacterium]
MAKEIITEELSIVVVARNHNPTILNPDFLKYNKIVPTDWELAGKPICADPVAQVTFSNGVNIVSQFDKVIFSEVLRDKKPGDVAIPGIAQKYVETLPHVDYRAVGINPKGHVVFTDEAEVQRYIVDNLLAPGPWRQFDEISVKAAIKFIYALKDCQLSLTIEEGKLQVQDSLLPVALFAANFHHDLAGESKEEKLKNLSKILDEWEKDLNLFREMVNERFLGISGKP